MKKAFDQTVRDLKREVNKKVLKVPGIEQKILDATSNEPWGPHGSHLADIAQATRNYHECQMIMQVIWKRLNDTGKNWRHVYKALTVLEYLVGHGSERVIDEIKEHVYQISTLSDFQYIDSSGRDQGSNVRRKSQSLVALVNDKERIQEVRQKAAANRDKYHSSYSSGGRSSYSGSGGYGDRNEDDRYEGRYRDEDRNGYGRERDWGSRDDERYGRGGDSYGRDGDRYGRDSDERYGKDSYKDDDYRGRRGNDDNQNGSRSRSLERERDRYSEEEDRYSSRHSGGRVDDPSQFERRLERKLSGQSPPPSYEEAVKDPQERMQDGRGVGNVPPPPTKAYSPPATKASPSASSSQNPSASASVILPSAPSKQSDGFDEFDPRGSMAATSASANAAGVDLFASDPVNSLALVPVTSATTSDTDVPANSNTGANFVPLSFASTAFDQPSEDHFGDGTFKALPQENFQAQEHVFAPAASVQSSSGIIQSAETLGSATQKVEPAPEFDFGDPLGGLSYMPPVTNGHQDFAANPQHIPSKFPTSQEDNSPFGATLSFGPSGFVPLQQTPQPTFPQNMHAADANYPPQYAQPAVLPSQPAGVPVNAPNPQIATAIHVGQPGLFPQPPQPAFPANTHAANMYYPLQSAQPAVSAPQTTAQPVGAPNLQTVNQSAQLGLSSQPPLQAIVPSPGQPPKDKFEMKSTVWADTLNRGLVNLNISGAKVNPLADIGVDFEAINRQDKRKEKSSAAPAASTVTMGKAMGSGSGVGRVGAGALAPSSNPMMGRGVGMGMGMGGGAAMGMGMGMGGGMNQPMGMGGYGGGMNQAMNQPMGMGGYGGGMNQPMGMGGYGGGMNRPMGMGMGMNMGMNQGAQMRPPGQGSGVPGVGYNPMGAGMGMGGYGAQQPRRI